MDFLAYLIIAYASQFAEGLESRRIETNSKIVARTIANGLEQFYFDHNRLPGRAGPDAQTTTSAKSAIVRILLAEESKEGVKQNLRNTNYLDGIGPAQARVTTLAAPSDRSSQWVSGLIIEGSTYALVDGWGNYYHVMMDSNFDGLITSPLPPVEATGAGLSKRAIVWSAGKDGNLETWGDNVKSWD